MQNSKQKYLQNDQFVNVTDEDLLDFIRAGNRAAFRELVEKYQQRLYSVAQRILGSESDAEDVVQESFVKAFLSIKNFKGDSAVYTWLYRIVFNMAIDERRRKARKGGTTEDFNTLLDAYHSELVCKENPEIATSVKQELTLLDSKLKHLTPEHKEILVMREVDGLAYDEIATILGLSRGTVMSRLFYARRNLLKLIEGDAELAEGIGLRLVQS